MSRRASQVDPALALIPLSLSSISIFTIGLFLDPSNSAVQMAVNKEDNGKNNEKGFVASTSTPMPEGEGRAEIDEIKYPTGPRFWAVVVALVLSMLLVLLRSSVQELNRGEAD